MMLTQRSLRLCPGSLSQVGLQTEWLGYWGICSDTRECALKACHRLGLITKWEWWDAGMCIGDEALKSAPPMLSKQP
jgi:hypothetical protein